MAYATRATIEAVFGVKNVAKWADLDNNGIAEAIAARIASAIAWADGEIDDRFRKSVYDLPIADADSTTPASIVSIASNLAGVWLYENRGVQDFDEDTGAPFHKLEYNRRRAENAIQAILSGSRTLDAVMRVTRTVPEVIDEEDE